MKLRSFRLVMKRFQSSQELRDAIKAKIDSVFDEKFYYYYYLQNCNELTPLKRRGLLLNFSSARSGPPN